MNDFPGGQKIDVSEADAMSCFLQPKICAGFCFLYNIF
jgi:hypothetical protein